MVKDIYLPEIPKTYTVSYFDETEWDKGLMPKEIAERDNFYELVWQDKVLNGSQYGPGKANFGELYRKIKSELDISKYSYPTYKISCDSDYYRGDSYNYAGAIIYAMSGRFSWTNSCGDASGRRGRSFYVIIKCTNLWPSEAFRTRGSGMVHNYLIQKALGYDVDDDNTVCGGGFGYQDGRLRFNSYPMNDKKHYWGFCENNEEMALSYYERKIVEDCWEKYKNCGSNFDKTYDIPYEVNNDLS